MYALDIRGHMVVAMTFRIPDILAMQSRSNAAIWITTTMASALQRCSQHMRVRQGSAAGLKTSRPVGNQPLGLLQN